MPFTLILLASLPLLFVGTKLVLAHLVSLKDEVAFTNCMELWTYLIGSACAFSGLYVGCVSPPGALQLLAVLMALGGLVMLIGLFGYQRQLSQDGPSTVFMFCIKVAYLASSFVVALLLGMLSFVLAKQAYDAAKQRQYAKAGLVFGSAAVSWKASGHVTTGITQYVNGPFIPAIAFAFPGHSIWGVLKQGFEGYAQRYAYQQRWKTRETEDAE